MAALDTVQKIVTRARFLLQDQTAPYRFSDDNIVEALNLGMLEVFRLRKDLFLTVETPTEYSSASMGASITLSAEYRMALLYFTCGYIQLSDEEETQDARATVFLNKAVSQLMTPVA